MLYIRSVHNPWWEFLVDFCGHEPCFLQVSLKWRLRRNLRKLSDKSFSWFLFSALTISVDSVLVDEIACMQSGAYPHDGSKIKVGTNLPSLTFSGRLKYAHVLWTY